MKKNYIILYDGVCLLCESWVNFVIKRRHDNANFYFIPFEYVILTKSIQHELISPKGENDSVLCISSDQKYFLKSDAIF